MILMILKLIMHQSSLTLTKLKIMKTKKLSFYLLALAAGFVLILGSCNKENNLTEDVNSSQGSLKSGKGPSANGQGSIFYNDNTRHFAFHANTKPNGSTEGSGVLTYNGAEIQIKFNIDCLSVAANIATMSGNVTSSTLDTWPVGTPVAFRVADNGEGSGSNPDQITLLQQSPGYDCLTWPGLPFNDVESGNIQVKP